jgi:hypothetical protein
MQLSKYLFISREKFGEPDGKQKPGECICGFFKAGGQPSPESSVLNW